MGKMVSREEGHIARVNGGKRRGIGGGGVGVNGGLERRNRGMREGCNAETCQKRAPGPPCGMWPVCLPRKYRAGEREERGKKGKRGEDQFCPIIEWIEEGREREKTKTRVIGREEGEVEK